VLTVLLVLSLLAPPPAPRPAGESRAAAGGGGILQQLVRRADGGYEHANRRAGFTATIHADGTVSFRDLEITDPSVKVLGIDLLDGKAHVPDGSLPSNTLVRPSDYASLGDDPLVKHGPYGPAPILISAGGRMAGMADLVAVTRRAHDKQRFLDATEPLRTKMGAEYRRKTERTALTKLDGELRTLWADPVVPLSVKKERLFQRWDECMQTPDDPHANAEQLARAKAGELARRRIEQWIRRQLPRSHVDAFTPAELRELNQRRRSRARFDPYAGRAIAPSEVGPSPPPAAVAAPGA
jgi:hypothetical protein